MREQQILQEFADDVKRQAESNQNESGWIFLTTGKGYCQWAEIREECDQMDYSCFDNSG